MIQFMKTGMFRQQALNLQRVFDHRRKDRLETRFILIDQFLDRCFLSSIQDPFFFKFLSSKTAHFKRVLPKSKQRVVCMTAYRELV
jgi:hypothetical protein